MSETVIFSEDDIRAYIRRMIGRDSVRVWAILKGLKPQQVDAFLRGERPLEPKIYKALGLERVNCYRYPK